MVSRSILSVCLSLHLNTVYICFVLVVLVVVVVVMVVVIEGVGVGFRLDRLLGSSNIR